MSEEKWTIGPFARRIIEGPGGMYDYEQHELVVWGNDIRSEAAAWALRCLANPHCEGSGDVLEEIMARREDIAENGWQV